MNHGDPMARASGVKALAQVRVDQEFPSTRSSRSGAVSSSQGAPLAMFSFASKEPDEGQTSSEGCEMTMQEIQDQIRAERLWWSEASERQVKKMEVTMEAQITQASQRLTNLNGQMEDKILRRLEEERQERQAALAVMRRDLDAQQVVLTEFARMPRNSVAETDVATREAQRAEILTTMKQLSDSSNVQVQAMEAAIKDIRRDVSELRSEGANLKLVETSLATLRSDCLELQLKQDQHIHALQESSGTVDMKLRGVEGTLASLSQMQLETSKTQEQLPKSDAIYELAQKVHKAESELSQRLQKIETSMRQEIEMSLTENRARCSQEVNTRLAEVSEAVQAERIARSGLIQELRDMMQAEKTSRVSQIQDVRETLQAAFDKTEKAFTLPASNVSAMEDKCKSLSKELENERSMRTMEVSKFSRDAHERIEVLSGVMEAERERQAGEHAELRNVYHGLCEKMERLDQSTRSLGQESVSEASIVSGMKELERRLNEALEKERADRGQELGSAKKTFDSLFESLQRSMQIKQDNDIGATRSDAARLTKEISNERLERANALAQLQKQIEALGRPEVSLRKLEAECQSSKQELADLRAQVQTEMSLKTLPELHGNQLDQAALGRDRSTLAARGELPSQMRADFSARMDSMDSEIRTEMGNKFLSLEKLLRSEINERVDTVDTDLRCEIAARVNALESEVRHANPGAGGPVLARIQSIEQDLKHIESQCCRYEGLAARLEALESTSALSLTTLESELQRILPNSGQTQTTSRGLALAITAGAASSAGASKLPSGAASPAPPTITGTPSLSSSIQGMTRSVTTPHAQVPPPTAEKLRAASREPAYTQHAGPWKSNSLAGSAQGPKPDEMAKAAFTERQAHEGDFDAGKSITPSRLSKGASPSRVHSASNGPITLMNASLKQSLEGLVSTLHSTLGDFEPSYKAGEPMGTPSREAAVSPGRHALREADRQSGIQIATPNVMARVSRSYSPMRPHTRIQPEELSAGIPPETSDSREVFKQALQELLEENRALQQETSQILESQIHHDGGNSVAQGRPLVSARPWSMTSAINNNAGQQGFGPQAGSQPRYAISSASQPGSLGAGQNPTGGSLKLPPQGNIMASRAAVQLSPSMQYRSVTDRFGGSGPKGWEGRVGRVSCGSPTR